MGRAFNSGVSRAVKEVGNMMYFTEQQKQKVVQTKIPVIEFKQLLNRNCESLKDVFTVLKSILSQIAEKISKVIQEILKEYRNLSSKEKYKTVRKLDKCGFTEKEINLMVCGAYHCRNNC
jgi:histone H3/H4